MTRILVTDGKGSFYESEYNPPEIGPTDIQVRAVMTGVCRSDIDMMLGNFPRLPVHMMGHEGLGQVIAVGTDVTDVAVGDYVATRGEPAYADVYNVRKNEYIRVPEAHPKYILEPVACAINVACCMKTGNTIIIGSGMLAHIVAQYAAAQYANSQFEIVVEDAIGRSNKAQWDRLNIDLKTEIPNKKYDNVVILNGIDFNQALDLCKENGRIIIGSPLK